ncbi:MAG: alcohol dehydrogenase catalytic domain-containing protein, partial [Actinomycetota bacterium]
MDRIREAISNGATGEQLSSIPLPSSYRAAVLEKADAEMFTGVASRDKDPRKSLKLREIPIPETAPDEAVVAMMASSINFNTVWSSVFEPVSTFASLGKFARESSWSRRHDLPYHAVGSDGCGVVLRVGSAVRNWKPGDRVTIHCNYVDDQDPSAHDDSMLGANQRIWGYETNFG